MRSCSIRTLRAATILAVATAIATTPLRLGAQAPSSRLAIVGATVIDPGSGRTIPDATIVVEDSLIRDVGPSSRVRVPAGARTIDGRGKWLLPGYIDAHVHFFQSGGLYTRPDAIDLRAVVPYEREIATIRSKLDDTFARYLQGGITSAIDVGGPFWNYEVRRHAAESPRAPRVYVAGPLISNTEPAALATDDKPIVLIRTADEARALVARQAAERTDLVKIWFTERGSVEEFLPIVRATIDESRRRGLRVAVHATSLARARAAVQAGADVLVHSVADRQVDDDFVRLLRERRVVLIPTILVMQRYGQTFAQKLTLTPEELRLSDPWVTGSLFDLRHLPADRVPARVRAMMADTTVRPGTSPVLLRNLERLHAGGVAIAAGTDAGNIGTLHVGSLVRELELMREAGMPPMAILASVTQGGAKVVARERELGAVRPGFRADLVLLDRDPIADIRNTSAVRMVVKNGVVHDPATVRAESAEEVVQRQLVAYNARDLDAFAGTYASDIVIYEHATGKEMMRGIDALRARYGSLFAANPGLHCEVVKRIVQGDFVIDQERVTGLTNGRTIEGTVIYEVKDGRIRRAWFVT